MPNWLIAIIAAAIAFPIGFFAGGMIDKGRSSDMEARLKDTKNALEKAHEALDKSIKSVSQKNATMRQQAQELNTFKSYANRNRDLAHTTILLSNYFALESLQKVRVAAFTQVLKVTHQEAIAAFRVVLASIGQELGRVEQAVKAIEIPSKSPAIGAKNALLAALVSEYRFVNLIDGFFDAPDYSVALAQITDQSEKVSSLPVMACICIMAAMGEIDPQFLNSIGEIYSEPDTSEVIPTQRL